MPGANCSIFGCSTSRKSKGIAIFRVPTGDDEYSTQWRKKIVDIVTKDREIDASLRSQIEKRTLHTCELHYPEETLLRNSTRTTKIPGALPTLNLPLKSFSKPQNERNTDSIEKRERAEAENTTKSRDCYSSFETFSLRTQKLKLPIGWEIKYEADQVFISFKDETHIIPKYEVTVNNNLDFYILVYNWLVPETNYIRLTYNSSMKNVTLSSLINEVTKLKICSGVNYKSDVIISHSVPKKFVETNEGPVRNSEFFRPKNCEVLSSDGICKTCLGKNKQHHRYEIKKLEKQQEPAKANAPLSLTSPDRLKLTVKGLRIENKELKHEISKLQKELTVPTSESLSNDLKSIMSGADPSKVSPFMQFFWEQQQSYLQASSTGVRYHPSIIRYCLALHSKSSSAYQDIRYDQKTGTGFLILPSERRLRDYKNYIHPQRGFNKNIIEELKSKFENFSEEEKYVALLLDEMKIQENLVWDKHTGELIGYVDLGDLALNSLSFDDIETIATHVLVFMVRGIVNPIKFSLANFATTGANSSQIFSLFWKAVSILELSCHLKVLAVTCDGASANRKFFNLHSRMQDTDSDDDIVYKTRNLYSNDGRFIHFIADMPHLIKTARNCLASSGAGKMTRYMWNDGNFILWTHITDIFYEDRECGLKLLPKLTFDHVKLTPYSVMNVRLAAQVLSNSVSQILTEYGSPDSKETARFCLMMDSFFDIVNIRSKSESKLKSKQNLKPFSSADDPRLSWLVNDFLGYFHSWKQSIENRPGKFDKTAQAKMFISRQTYEGLQITVHSIVDCVKFLLHNKICSYVLTERFSQDPLENYFGRQRSMGARKDNPTLRDVGYNDNAIRNQKVFRSIAGNVGGVDHGSVEISNEPLPSRKKAKLSSD